jgi:hypothetical protein
MKVVTVTHETGQHISNLIRANENGKKTATFKGTIFVSFTTQKWNKE